MIFTIVDIVLIDRLDLDMAGGLTVLTGETGAGKSILLDALGLALGARSDRALVRAGARQGTVVATFHLDPAHAAFDLLRDRDIDVETELVLRRTVTADGRSRCFVNDDPVGAGLLRELASHLVEVHGQGDQQGLADSATHRQLLDEAGGHVDLAADVRGAHEAWRRIEQDVARRLEAIEEARRDEDYLRHRLAELEDLAPAADEEEALLSRRQRLMGRGRFLAVLDEVADHIVGAGGAIEHTGQALRRIERSGEAERLPLLLQALERAAIEMEDVTAQLEAARDATDEGEGSLEEVEERLFALRDAARKHRTAVEALPQLLDDTRTALAAIDTDTEALTATRRLAGDARADYDARAARLSDARRTAASTLEQSVACELPPLRLGKARFKVTLEDQPPSAGGLERVGFEVATNPGQAFGPLTKIASGGELSRLMLALKVVLARGDTGRTLIFDEIDAGIGGATADAVGERLARLARGRQVLVVTHAPQVAARADHHLLVEKSGDDTKSHVAVRALDSTQRLQEVARMLAGAEVTPAARAAAASLMTQGQHA